MEVLSVAELEKEHGNINEFTKQSRKSVRHAKREYEKKFESRLNEVRSKKGERLLTRAETALHNRSNDEYVIVNGVVYDVSMFLDFHPGGRNILLNYAGKDATTAFEDMGHSLAARLQLADLYVGDLPLIERVALMESDDENSDSDDSQQNLKSSKRKEELPSTVSTSAAKEANEPRPDPVVRRIVANRYRKTVRENGEDLPDDGQELVKKLGPPRVRAANDWKVLLQWRILKTVIPSLFGHLMTYTHSHLENLPRFLLIRFVDLWNKYAKTLLLVLFSCFVCYLCYYMDSAELWKRTPATSPSHGLSTQDFEYIGILDDQNQPPAGHDPTAILYF